MLWTENFGRLFFMDLVSGSASVLTFWTLTEYLCGIVYNGTSRPRHSKSYMLNYVLMCTIGLRGQGTVSLVG